MDESDLNRLSYLIIQSAEDTLIVELKAQELVLPVHRAQVMSYLRLTDKPLGLLINFHVDRLVLGVDRIVNKLGWPKSLTMRSQQIAVK